MFFRYFRHNTHYNLSLAIGQIGIIICKLDIIQLNYSDLEKLRISASLTTNVAELEIKIDRLGDGEAAEIIEDFAQISTLDSNSISDEQDEEIAFMELVEYVRVSVQLLYEDYRGYKNES